jgi:hypothetical protein
MHRPSLHRNSDSEHGRLVPPQLTSVSSELSPQSFSESHNQRRGIHLPLDAQRNSPISSHGRQLWTPSSELSRQSSWPLQKACKVASFSWIEEAHPFGYAAIAGGATCPTSAAGHTATFRGFVGIVSAIIVRIAFPSFRNTFLVGTLKFFGVACPIRMFCICSYRHDTVVTHCRRRRTRPNDLRSRHRRRRRIVVVCTCRSRRI